MISVKEATIQRKPPVRGTKRVHVQLTARRRREDGTRQTYSVTVCDALLDLRTNFGRRRAVLEARRQMEAHGGKVSLLGFDWSSVEL